MRESNDVLTDQSELPARNLDTHVEGCVDSNETKEHGRPMSLRTRGGAKISTGRLRVVKRTSTPVNAMINSTRGLSNDCVRGASAKP